MKVESVAVDVLSFDAHNARKHSDKNLSAIQGSLEQFGQRKPIVVTAENVVVAGNGTLQAALNLGWKKIDVVRVPVEWSADQVKAFALADNRTAELAEWDSQVLSAQLLELYEADFDVEKFGFELPQEIEMEIEDEDEMPTPKETRVAQGDLWQLGNHRVFCGDALEASAYEALLGDERADLVWTDPPYGVSYVGKTKDALTIQNDTLDMKGLEEFLRDAFTMMFAYSKEGACWYVAAPSGDLFLSFALPLHELEVWRHTIVWVKDTLVLGRADYHYRHESIFYGWKPGAAHQEPPNRKQDTVWEFDRPKASKEHPTMKPIDLILRSVENSSRVGDIVLDSFAGSGSTLIACEHSKRIARVMEVDPFYCDVILTRWEKLTGEKAVKL
jgi:DNA modification methylase